MANIKSEFDEYGVSEDVLAELQHVSLIWSDFAHPHNNVLLEMGEQSYSIPCCRV